MTDASRIAELEAEVERLRRRTHEIQEAADQRYSAYVQRMKNWMWAIDIADQMLKDPETHTHSAYARALVAHLILQRNEAIDKYQALRDEQIRATAQAISERRRVVPLGTSAESPLTTKPVGASPLTETSSDQQHERDKG